MMKRQKYYPEKSVRGTNALNIMFLMRATPTNDRRLLVTVEPFCVLSHLNQLMYGEEIPSCVENNNTGNLIFLCSSRRCRLVILMLPALSCTIKYHVEYDCRSCSFKIFESCYYKFQSFAWIEHCTMVSEKMGGYRCWTFAAA